LPSDTLRAFRHIGLNTIVTILLTTAYIICIYLNNNIRVDDIKIGKNNDIGFYIGLLGTATALGQLSTTMLWARMSDIFGRKPILLLGLLGIFIFYMLEMLQQCLHLDFQNLLHGSLLLNF
jgi:MFS family permease